MFKDRKVALIIAVAIILKAILLLLPYNGLGISPFEDPHIDSWRMAGRTIAEGGELYGPKNEVYKMDPKTQFSYNYLPLWGLLAVFLLWLGELTKLGFPIFFQMTLFAAELATAVLIYHLLKGANRKIAVLAGLVYIFNPITLWAGFFFHQIDALPVFFMTAAVYWFNREKPWAAAILLSIATMFKTFPLFLLPLFFLRMKSGHWPAFAALYAVPLLILTAPFVLSLELFRAFLSKVVFYTPIYGSWGFSKFLAIPIEVGKAGLLPGALGSVLSSLAPFLERMMSVLLKTGFVFLGAGLLLTYWLTRKRDLHYASVVTLVTVMVFSFFYYPHYMVWVLPLFLTLSLWWSLRYLTIASVFSVAIIISNALHIKIGSTFINPLSIMAFLASFATWLFGLWFLSYQFGWRIPFLHRRPAHEARLRHKLYKPSYQH